MDMATFTMLVKKFSVKIFCSKKYLGLAISENFHIANNITSYTVSRVNLDGINP